MKSVVPRRKPGEFPFVRNRNNVATMQVLPSAVAAVLAFGRRRRLLRIAGQPVGNHIFIKLLGPQQAGISLAGHSRTLDRAVVSELGGVKLVSLTAAKIEDLVESRAQCLPRRFVFGEEA